MSSGDMVTGDKITVGNISDSYTAIGAGAQVIVNQIQEALSTVDEQEKAFKSPNDNWQNPSRRKSIASLN